MKNCIVVAVVIALCGSLVGCNANGPKESGGSILGGVSGALIGSQFGKGSGQLIGVAIGALAGSQLGGMLGRNLDERDKQMAQQTLQKTLENAPDNRVNTWRNPNTSHQGDIAVQRTVDTGSSVCRDYTHTVRLEGQQEVVHGRACRNARGAWIIQN